MKEMSEKEQELDWLNTCLRKLEKILTDEDIEIYTKIASLSFAVAETRESFDDYMNLLHEEVKQ